MDVESSRHVRLGLAGRYPLRVVVLVAAVVQRNDVHQQDVLGARVESFQRHFERRKHPPAVRTEQIRHDEQAFLFRFWSIISNKTRGYSVKYTPPRTVSLPTSSSCANPNPNLSKFNQLFSGSYSSYSQNFTKNHPYL